MNENVLEDGLEDVNWPALCWCRFLSVGLGEKVQALCFAEVRNDVSAIAHMRTSTMLANLLNLTITVAPFHNL